MTDVEKLSDEQLVEIVRTRDQEMYRHVMERYQQRLYRYAQSLTGGDEAAAADVVQNAFIKAFTNLRGFNVKRQFSSWLYRITHNEAMNYLRKHRREVHPNEQWFNNLEDVRPDLLEAFEGKQQRQWLASAIGRLSLKYREPLILYFFQQQSYEEIAKVLHLPINSVGTRIRRAKAKLKDILAEKGQANDW